MQQEPRGEITEFANARAPPLKAREFGRDVLYRVAADILRRCCTEEFQWPGAAATQSLSVFVVSLILYF